MFIYCKLRGASIQEYEGDGVIYLLENFRDYWLV